MVPGQYVAHAGSAQNKIMASYMKTARRELGKSPGNLSRRGYPRWCPVRDVCQACFDICNGAREVGRRLPLDSTHVNRGGSEIRVESPQEAERVGDTTNDLVELSRNGRPEGPRLLGKEAARLLDAEVAERLEGGRPASAVQREPSRALRCAADGRDEARESERQPYPGIAAARVGPNVDQVRHDVAHVGDLIHAWDHRQKRVSDRLAKRGVLVEIPLEDAHYPVEGPVYALRRPSALPARLVIVDLACDPNGVGELRDAELSIGARLPERSGSQVYECRVEPVRGGTPPERRLHTGALLKRVIERA